MKDGAARGDSAADRGGGEKEDGGRRRGGRREEEEEEVVMMGGGCRRGLGSCRSTATIPTPTTGGVSHPVLCFVSNALFF